MIFYYFLLIKNGFCYVIYLIYFVYIVSDCNNWRLPCYTSFAIISIWFAIAKIITSTPVFAKRNKKKLFIDIGGTLLLLVILFVGLTYRFALSIGILSLILIRIAKSENVPVFMIWTSITLCAFPLLPVVEPYPRVYIVYVYIENNYIIKSYLTIF